MGVVFTHKGDFTKTEEWLNKLRHKEYLNMLATFGDRGVNALRAATPIDSGLAANSWRYQIEESLGTTSLVWINDDIEGGCNVAVLIDRGHATKSGSWVPGRHFIDPAIDPIIKDLADTVWKEATRA